MNNNSTKAKKKKLSLRVETIRTIESPSLEKVAGGTVIYVSNGGRTCIAFH